MQVRRARIRTATRHRAPNQEPGRILIPGDGAAGDQGAQNRPACAAIAATRRLRPVPSQRFLALWSQAHTPSCSRQVTSTSIRMAKPGPASAPHGHAPLQTGTLSLARTISDRRIRMPTEGIGICDSGRADAPVLASSRQAIDATPSWPDRGGSSANECLFREPRYSALTSLDAAPREDSGAYRARSTAQSQSDRWVYLRNEVPGWWQRPAGSRCDWRSRPEWRPFEGPWTIHGRSLIGHAIERFSSALAYL